MLQLPGDGPGLSIQAMLRALAVALVALVACTDGPAADDEQRHSCPILDDGCPPESAECTACQPIGADCDSSTSVLFCARGFGWCTESGVCREICRDAPRCPGGTHATHEEDVCFCVPD